MRRIGIHRVSPLALAHPLARYAALFGARGASFLLGGSSGANERASFDLLGGEPVASFRAWRHDARDASGRRLARIRVEERGRTLEHEGDFIEALRAFVHDASIGFARGEGAALPLVGGAVGYIGYECGQMLERLPSVPRPRLDLPDAVLHVHDWAIGVERASGRAFLSVVGRGDDPAAAEEDEARTRAGVLALVRALEGVGHEAARPLRRGEPRGGAPAPWTDAAGYQAKVRRAKALIDAGDAFEICLTNRVDVPFDGDPLALFEALGASSPAPYSAWLALPEAKLVSSSPERFVHVDVDGTVESRPIKGTRPRSDDPAEDAAHHRDLATNEKDVAENTMIVDLVRNDLGKVCVFGSVTVPELCAVESYATVHQLVSSVRGKLSPGMNAVDAVTACFPPGSMTGAPKVEAMTRIEELEPVERGPYAGALGYFGFDGAADFSVVIRTAVVKDGVAHLGTGGAVTTDSTPEGEHDETEVKLRGLLEALAGLDETRGETP